MDSFTIKINGDSKDFQKELKKADREINKTAKTASNLKKSLEFEFDADRAVQAQKQYQSALLKTEKKADALRERLKAIQSFDGIETEEYSRLQLELAQTETKAIELRGELEKLNDIKIDRLTNNFKDAGEKIKGFGERMAGISVAAAGMIAGVAAVGKSAANTGAEIDDMTQRFDVSAETIQRWNYLSLQAGVDTTVFSKALMRARAAMADLSTGSINAASKSLEAIGISANQFANDEDMFEGILNSIAALNDKTLQTAYANEIFGDKIATQLLPYINAGADDLAKWNAEFDAMPSLTGEEAAALANLDDVFNRLSTTMDYAFAQMGIAFAPLIERVVEWIENGLVPAIEGLSEWFEKLSPSMQNTIASVVGILAVASPLLVIVGKMSVGIGALIKVFSGLHKAQMLVAAGFAAIIGAAVLGFNTISQWKNMTWVERVLNTLAVAALAAAGAVMTFHASWSLGLAVGAIAAAVTAGLGILNAAKSEILPQEKDYSVSDIKEISTPTVDFEGYMPQNAASGGGYYSDSSSNDQWNVTINVNGSGMSAEEVAEAVGRKIATLAQSRR